MKKKPKNLKQALENKLTKDQLSNLRRAYDVIGDIIIIEIPEEVEKKEKLIAETLLDMHKNIKVVCKKVGIHSGEFRTQKLKILAGARRKETEYKENDCRIKLNVEKCYFSPRLSTERKRIASLVKKGEDVLVMFSGVAPYPLVIGRNSEANSITGIEKNPVAAKYAAENLPLNKTVKPKINLICGDVNEIIPKFPNKFDRILMPLPKGAESFLDIALSVIKSKGMIHFYDFLAESDFGLAEKKIKEACKRAKKRCKIIEVVRCGQFGPRIHRICVDFQVL